MVKEVVAKSDYGIDLHSAAAPRINFPNIRGDLSLPSIKLLSGVFGCELIVNPDPKFFSMRNTAETLGTKTRDARR